MEEIKRNPTTRGAAWDPPSDNDKNNKRLIMRLTIYFEKERWSRTGSFRVITIRKILQEFYANTIGCGCSLKDTF